MGVGRRVAAEQAGPGGTALRFDDVGDFPQGRPCRPTLGWRAQRRGRCSRLLDRGFSPAIVPLRRESQQAAMTNLLSTAGGRTSNVGYE